MHFSLFTGPRLVGQWLTIVHSLYTFRAVASKRQTEALASVFLFFWIKGIINTWEENFTLNNASVIMFLIFSWTCLRNIFFHGHCLRHFFFMDITSDILFFMDVVSVISFSGYGPDLLSEILLSIDVELQTYLLKWQAEWLSRRRIP